MVIEVEQDFPRGGTQKLNKSGTKRPQKEKDLFQLHPPQEKKRKKRSKSKITEAEIISVPSHLSCSDLNIEPLTSKLICEGMFVYGSITDVQDYKILVSLPNFHCGSIPINRISSSYTEHLEHIAENQETDEQIMSLQDMFTIGSVYTCKIIEIKKSFKKKQYLTLTVNPSDVNEFLRLEDLEPGRILQTAVKSKEDHGYVMDSGIKGVHGFLNNEDAMDFINERNNGCPLGVGQILRCVVKAISGVVVLLSAKPKRVSKTVLTEKVPFHTILPGTQVSATVLKVTDLGLYLRVFDHIGIVQKLHLERQNLTLYKYNKHDTVVGHVLYIHPVLKVLYISLQRHLSLKNPKYQFAGCSLKEVTDETEVTEVSKSGFFLRLKDKYLGYCRKLEAVEKVTSNLDLKKKISVGSSPRCRILSFSYVDNVILVSTRKSKVNQQYSNYEDLKPGDEVQCKVKEFHPNGMLVEIGYRINGFINNAHNADYPLKFPDKKFKIGDILNCRVLTVYPSKQRIALTNKQTLVKSSIPPLTSFENIQKGQVVQGVVVLLSSSFMLVSFYNDMRGIINSRSLLAAGINVASKSYYIGQVITCVVENFDAVQRKLFLSLETIESIEKKVTRNLQKFPIGSLVDCKVMTVKEEGLNVLILPSEIQAFIPVVHLSDHFKNCRLLLKTFTENSVISRVLCFCIKKQKCIMSLRPSLCNAANQKLEVGNIAPGIVRAIDPNGIHIDLINGKKGLVPKSLISNKHNAPLTPVHVNQKKSIECKIIKKKSELFLLSISLDDCYKRNPTSIFSFLMNYLKETEKLRSFYSQDKGVKSALASVSQPGTKKSFKIKEISNTGVTGILDNGVKCVISQEHLPTEDLKLNETVEGMVLFADFSNDCLEMTAKPNIIKSISKWRKNCSSQIEEEQVYNGQVLLQNDIFMLVMLKGPASGNLVYVPSQQHPNDLLGRQHLYTVGFNYKVVIKRIEDPFVIALAENPESNFPKKKPEIKKATKRELPVKIGDVVLATITKIFDFQMNIMLPGKFRGRVFVTEVTDSIKEGQNPLKAFKGGAQVKVRVIGFRITDDPSKLPLSHRGFIELAECSMRPSILNQKELVESSIAPDIKERDIVNAYVKKFTFPFLYLHITPSLEGRIAFPKAVDVEKLFPLGAAYRTTVLKKEEDILDLSIQDAHIQEASNFVTGKIIKYKVGNYILVDLPHKYKGTIFLTDLTDRFKNADHLLSQLKEQQKNVRCYVLDVDHKKKRAILSLRKSRVKPDSSYQIENPEVVSVEIGKTYQGFVCSIAKHGLFVLLGRNLEGFLPSSYIPETRSDLQKGMVVQVTVADILTDSDKILLLWGECKVTRIDLIRVRNEASHMFASSRRRRTVSENSDSSVISDGNKRKRTDSQSSDVIFFNTKNEKKTRNDSETSEIIFNTKTAKRTRNDSEVSEIIFNTKNEERTRTDSEASDSSSDPEMETSEQISPKKSTDKNTDIQEVKTPINLATVKGVEADIQEAVTSINLTTWRSNVPVKSKEDILQAPCLELEEDFFWSKEKEPEKPKDMLVSSSSEESDQEDNALATKKKKTRLEAKQEEEKLYKMERILADEDRLPQTVDDFDRLVMSSPDSSVVWLKYMAFHLQDAEVDKPEQWQSVLFKPFVLEEQEKFNVWIALLNLENLYGSPETLEAIFKRALKSNEPIKIYKQLTNIYISTKKFEQAEDLFNTMVKRFSLVKDVWISYAIFLMRNSKFEAARVLLQRSLRSLPQKDSVEVISKFAQLEFKYGDQERGRTMFESIVSNYPKRSDLWSIYIDMMLKTGDIDAVRQIFERVVTLQVSVKKMKFFFKKYLSFEKEHGDDMSVEHVKQKALEYVESKSKTD